MDYIYSPWVCKESDATERLSLSVTDASPLAQAGTEQCHLWRYAFSNTAPQTYISYFTL